MDALFSWLPCGTNAHLLIGQMSYILDPPPGLRCPVEAIRGRSPRRSRRRKKEISGMKRTRLVLFATAIATTLMAVSTLPAAAQGFGPSVFCNGRTFDGCTDSYHPSYSEESFSYEGTIGDVAGCTKQRTAEAFPYCVFVGHEPSEARDVYLCGPEPEQGL